MSVIRPMSFLISRVIIKKWFFSACYTEFQITTIVKAEHQSFLNKKINLFLHQPAFILMEWKNDMHTSKKPSDSHGTITVVWSNFMEITKHSTLLWKWLNKNNPWSPLFRICLHVRSLWSFNFFLVYFCFVLTICTENPKE